VPSGAAVGHRSGTRKGSTVAHIEGPQKHPGAWDFKRESWRDLVWLLIPGIGVVLLVLAAVWV